MHRLASVTSGALLTLAMGSAVAQDHVQLTRYFDGNRLVFCFSVPMSRVVRLPRWNGKDNPPISRERATEVGVGQLRGEYPKIERFELQREELNRVAIDYTKFRGDVWYYLIEYAAIVDGERRYDSTKYVATVLLDGSSVPKQTEGCAKSFSEATPNPAFESGR